MLRKIFQLLRIMPAKKECRPEGRRGKKRLESSGLAVNGSQELMDGRRQGISNLQILPRA